VKGKYEQETADCLKIPTLLEDNRGLQFGESETGSSKDEILVERLV